MNINYSIALQQDPAVLKQVFEAIADGVVGFDLEGKIVFCNPGMALIVGYSIPELIGKTAYEAWGEEGRISLLPQGSSTTEEKQIRSKSGEVKFISERHYRLPSDPSVVVGIYRDITTRKTRERLMQAAFESTASSYGEEFFAELARSIADSLEVRCVMIGELLGDQHVRSLALLVDGKTRENLTYGLEGTPCRRVLTQGICEISCDVSSEFPDGFALKQLGLQSYLGVPFQNSNKQPTGLIAVMSGEVRHVSDDHLKVLRFFAARAGAELERLRSVRLIRDRESRLSAIFDTVLDAIVTMDEKGMIESFNPAAERMFGYTQEEAVGNNVQILMPADLGQHHQSYVNSYMRTGNTKAIGVGREVTARRKDGTQFPVNIALSEIRTLSHRVFVGVIRNLTEVKQSEHATREYVEYLENLNRISTLIASTGDMDSMIQEVISAVREIFDADRAWLIHPCNEEAEGCVVTVESNRPDFPSSLRPSRHLPSSGMLKRMCREALATDGPIVYQTSTLAPKEREYSESHGIVSRLVFRLRPRVGAPWLFGLHQCSRPRDWSATEKRLFGDVGQRMAEAISNMLLFTQIENSEERYRSVVNSIREGLFQADLNGILTYVNPGWSVITGFSVDESIGASFLNFIHANHREELRKRMAKIAQGGDQTGRFEVRLATKSMGERWAEVTPAPAADAEGRITGLSGTVEDVTERRLATMALHESENRYRHLVELSPLAMIVHADLKFIFLNHAALRLIGARDSSQLAGRSILDFFHREDHVLLHHSIEGIEAARESGEIPIEREYIQARLIRIDGQQIDVESTGIPVRYENRKAFQVVLHDITERKRAADELRRSEERYALAAEGANDGLWDWDLQSDTVYYSPRWLDMLGIDRSERTSDKTLWFQRIHPDDYAEVQTRITAHLQKASPQLDVEHRLRHDDGTYRWMTCRGLARFDESAKAIRLAGSIRDINEQKIAQEQLVHNAFHDSLTGLANRSLFLEHLERALAISKRREDYLFAVFFIDFDRFKVVNDSLGHLIGDKLLKAITQRLAGLLRPGDLFARLGGDEFAVLVDDLAEVVDAQNLANRLQQSFALPFNVDGHEIFTTASIGIAFSSSHYRRPDDLLRDADTAMYRAKALGKARHVVFDTQMRREATELMRLEMDLNNALRRGEFQVKYQTIHCADTRRIMGFEALVRWQHPDRGLVDPDAFIPLAEETGIIVQIGLRVLREACRDLVRWQKDFPSDPPMFVAVNLSARQFLQPDLTRQVEHILKESGLPSGSLKLELTESILMNQPDITIELLNQLRRIGIRLCIDDFGVGYSSLSYLHRLPMNSLKIDRSFISRIGKNVQNASIVPTIINMAHNLGLDVVAEGIETEVQLNALRNMNCEMIQGYYYSRPMPANNVPLFLEQFRKR